MVNGKLVNRLMHVVDFVLSDVNHLTASITLNTFPSSNNNELCNPLNSCMGLAIGAVLRDARRR